jgi:hypothetical protein
VFFKQFYGFLDGVALYDGLCDPHGKLVTFAIRNTFCVRHSLANIFSEHYSNPQLYEFAVCVALQTSFADGDIVSEIHGFYLGNVVVVILRERYAVWFLYALAVGVPLGDFFAV